MRALLLRLAPERWREAIAGDLEESARRVGRFRPLWVLLHLAVIVVRLRLALLAERLPCRAPSTRQWLADGWQDVRYGARRWAARPAFAAAAVATLSLGVGATSALFTIVDGVLLKPLPYPHADRLVTINRTYPEWRQDPILVSSWDRISLAFPEFFYIRERSRALEALAVISTRTAVINDGAAREARAAVVSASFFRILGIAPALGVGFGDDADLRDPGTMLISHAAWTRRFGADPGIVGRSVPLRGGTRVVAGVLPEDFSWGSLARPYDFWYPLAAIPGNERADNNRYLDTIARLAPGATTADATDEMSVLLRDTFGFTSPTAAVATPFMERQLSRVRTPLMLLLAGALLLLVIACANVAGLLTGDAASRGGEMAVRASLGASGGRLLRQLLVEAGLLSLAATALGLLAAIWGVRALVRLAPPDMPRLSEIGLDWRIAAAACATAAMTAAVFAVLPAFTLRRAQTLNACARRSVTARHRATAALALVEIALGVTLLAGAGLFVRSLRALEQVDAGFDRSRMLTLRAGLPPSPIADDNRATQFFERAQEAVRVLPGVVNVAVSTNLAFVSGRSSTTISVPRGGAATDAPFEAQRRIVSPEYFGTLRIATLSGRTFDETDRRHTTPVAVVSRGMERRLWPDGAVGRRLTYGGAAHTVIGVVNDVRDVALDDEPQATFYLSTRQRPAWSTMRIIVRTAVEPASLAAVVRNTVARLDPEVPVEEVVTMDDIVHRQTDDERYRTVLMGVFALAAAALAGVGLYSTLARRVLDRRREIGVRLALGARPAQVRRLFLSEGLRLAAAGIAVGLPLAAALGRAARSLLFGVSPTDAGILTTVVIVVGALAVLATYIPSIRASRLDPVTTLRSD